MLAHRNLPLVSRPPGRQSQPSVAKAPCAVAQPRLQSSRKRAKTSQNSHAANRTQDFPEEDASDLRLVEVLNAVGSGQQQDFVEPDKQASSPVKTRGLHRTPLSGGVNATLRYDLPPPPVAARNLVEQAALAHLCTTMSKMHHRRAGYPFGTVVDFASDGAGAPIFCLSPLAIHTRNIMEDARCSMVVQMPGWTGLANARVTIFGDVYQLPAEMQAAAREIFLEKHATEKKERWVSANLLFFRMHRILDIFFVGGFGTVQWVDPKEYSAIKPDNIVMSSPLKTLQALNDQCAASLQRLLARPGTPVDDVLFISVDRLGADVRVRRSGDYSVERLGFASHVHTLEEALAATQHLLHRGLQPPNESTS
ncbi:hypothetical protein WJX73_000437 [Symbiochloris irregularis]|uniref:CREG-like beta-barrel domain-containing protein n=1 Tax=Symbiochloris irregularis TaxID=706552 RepID=A0AAW1PES2_9CHLO